MAGEEKKFVEMGKKGFARAVVIVAAGGDASRMRASLIEAAKNKNNERLVRYLSEHYPNPESLLDDNFTDSFTGVTVPIGPVTGESSFERILGTLKEIKDFYQLEEDIPVVINVGPNTKTAIEKKLIELDKFSLTAPKLVGTAKNFPIIEQKAKPVFDQEGKILTTKGKLLLAPDGTGGVIEAFYHSPLFEFYKSKGKDKVLFWHGNFGLFEVIQPFDIIYGAMGKADGGNADLMPLVSGGVYPILANLCDIYTTENFWSALANGNLPPIDDREKVDSWQEQIEDNIHLWVLSFRLIENIVGKFKDRPQLKQLFIRDANGNLIKGYKMEKFLSEAIKFSC
jgi:hypothetical protein